MSNIHKSAQDKKLRGMVGWWVGGLVGWWSSKLALLLVGWWVGGVNGWAVNGFRERIERIERMGSKGLIIESE